MKSLQTDFFCTFICLCFLMVCRIGMAQPVEKELVLVSRWGGIEVEEEAVIAKLGDFVVAPSDEIVLTKRYAKKREIAPTLKNNIILCQTADRAIVAAHTALPLLKKFTADGTLLWSKGVSIPALEQIREKFFEANDTAPARMSYSLKNWNDIAADRDGGFYLLLNDREKLRIFHFDASGKFVEILNGPAGYFSKMCLSQNELWVYQQDEQMFYLFRLYGK